MRNNIRFNFILQNLLKLNYTGNLITNYEYVHWIVLNYISKYTGKPHINVKNLQKLSVY